MSWRRHPTRDMIGSAQSAHLVNSVILTRHTACLAPPNVTILRMYISSESLLLPPAKRLALRMPQAGHLNKARRPEPPSKPSPSPASHRTQESMGAPCWIQATGVVFGFRRFRARWVAFYRSAQPWKSCAWERGRSKLYRNCCRQFFKSKLLLRSSKAILGYLVGETREREAEWTSRQSG